MCIKIFFLVRFRPPKRVMPFPAMSPQDAAMLRLNHNAAAAGLHPHHPHHPHHHPAVSGSDSPFSPFPSHLPPTSMADHRSGGGSGMDSLVRPPPLPPHGPPPPFGASSGLQPHHLPMGAGAAHLMSSLNSPAAQVRMDHRRRIKTEEGSKGRRSCLRGRNIKFLGTLAVLH